MQKKVLIKNGIIVTSKATFIGDILSKNGKIKRIGVDIDGLGAKIYDAQGKYVFPGGIDPHVHLALQTPAGKSADNFFTGSKAAIAGGTTCIIDFVTPEKEEPLSIAFEKRKKEAQNSLIDFAFHMSITYWHSNTAQEIKACKEQLGMPSFKTYLAYKGKNGIGLEDADFINVLDAAQKNNALVTVHAEHGDIINFLRKKFIAQGKTQVKYHPQSRPEATEAEAVERAILLAKKTQAALYIVHVSSQKSMKIIAKAQAKGWPIFAETCPQYLLLDEQVYYQPFEKSAPYVLSPPIRAKENHAFLWKALKNGTVTALGTDHCPFNLKHQKELGKLDFTKIPNGAGGIEHRLELLYTYGVLKNKISLQEFVYLCSTGAANLFGLSHKKGDIAVGLDADLVIFNPNTVHKISTKTHHQHCDSNIYEGFRLKGKVEQVFLRGKLAFDNGVFTNPAQKGEYIFRQEGSYIS